MWVRVVADLSKERGRVGSEIEKIKADKFEPQHWRKERKKGGNQRRHRRVYPVLQKLVMLAL